MRWDIDSIRSALPIEQLLLSRGAETRRGRGPCPLCGTSDRSTSFCVRGARWRCFACAEHGDVLDLLARLDGVPLREAFARGAALAGLRPLKHGEHIPPRPKAPWRAARETRDQAWDRYSGAVMDREWASEQFAYFRRRRGLDHVLTSFAGEVLASAYDAEAQAEYAYECVVEACR